MGVDTGKVAGRRTLRFNTPDEVLRDAESLVAAERTGTLKQIGNWPLGTTLGHLSAFIDYAYDGFPAQLKPPWIIKVLIRTQRRKFFEGPMPAGVKIPRIKQGTLGIEPFSTAEGWARCKRSWERLAAGPPKDPHPIFGPLTHTEWKAMHFRHAELHLSFYSTG